MRKHWLIYTICSTVLVGCSFIQYIKSINDTSEDVDLVVKGDKVGPAPDFKAIKKISERKKKFFSYLIPGIEYENSLIALERERIIALKGQDSLNNEDKDTLKKFAKRYRVDWPEEGDITPAWFNGLLEKVDVLPIPLVLIQAANESAWGTSRFARDGNNYFGQWCYTEGCGLVPLARGDGMTHEVAKFSSVQRSIHYYFLNVNRNDAYEDLRKIRATRRANGKTMLTAKAAYDLTNGLVNYSEKGQRYVDIIQTMLDHNSKYWKPLN
ncbi:glucosaminidase domain-containing protein [Vibrio viridaestus]|uniref:Glucosaminidase n=1 Tax=Vibrio viridaestus TaxID=2487322 RepID=A0A3N9THF5_9VIBR|nr:glucosaminidase domain-containing protein [Vibrio viridaestus]RQW63579.1 glucosaminidase [Vibrio viridaestus]